MTFLELSGKKVLVTGGTGFIASHMIKKLLEEGCLVRTSVRNVENKNRYKALYTLVPEKNKNLEIVEGDLLDESCWSENVKGCDYVLHMASPVFMSTAQPSKCISMAVNGTRHVLEACLKHNIKKVVVTSSGSAIYQNKDESKRYFNENDWSETNKGTVYDQSKTLAEKEAWRIAYQSKGKLNVTTINPTLVFGKFLLPNPTHSSKILVNIFNAPLLPKTTLAIVSVDSVVQAHLMSLKKPNETRGKRYILSEGSYWLGDIIDIIREEFEQFGYSFAKYYGYYFLVRLMGCFNPEYKYVADNWGIRKIYDSTKSKEDLGIKYRFHRDYIVESIYSIIDKGFLPNKIRKIKGKKLI